MGRRKKDGRFINYYIDRGIFERLERYAEDRAQPMTTALERILEEHLDRYEAELARMERYCPNCHVLVRGNRCPACGSKWLEEPKGEDYCILAEKDTVWAGVLEHSLRENGIPYLTESVQGAGLTAKIGTMFDKTRFYVRYACYEKAQALEEELFAAGAAGHNEEEEV